MKTSLVLSSLFCLLANPVITLAADPTADMRALARTFASLEANDLKGFCAAMHGPAYADYLSRVCQSAVQHKLKQSDACTPELIVQEAKADKEQCLQMPAAEFEEKVRVGRKRIKTFIEDMTAQGVDGEKLLHDERQMEQEQLREICCEKPVPEHRKTRGAS